MKVKCATTFIPLATIMSVFLLLTFQLSAISNSMPTADIAGKAKVTLEVASSESEITRGLMYRTSLAPNSGMVFLFRPPRLVNFWMYHTLIPLDMLFIKNGTIVKLCQDVPPCKSENPHDCKTYPGGNGIEASEVIELAAGYAKKHGIKEGDQVTFQFQQKPTSQD